MLLIDDACSFLTPRLVHEVRPLRTRRRRGLRPRRVRRRQGEAPRVRCHRRRRVERPPRGVPPGRRPGRPQRRARRCPRVARRPAPRRSRRRAVIILAVTGRLRRGRAPRRWLSRRRVPLRRRLGPSCSSTPTSPLRVSPLALGFPSIPTSAPRSTSSPTGRGRSTDPSSRRGDPRPPRPSPPVDEVRPRDVLDVIGEAVRERRPTSSSTSAALPEGRGRSVGSSPRSPIGS